MLQRMMEHVYYADLLTQASQAPTTLEELPYLAAFVLSAYPHTIYRMAKPFNPLLGETFECDRRAEVGWRSFMEQVSLIHVHHVYVHVHVNSYPFRGHSLSVIILLLISLVPRPYLLRGRVW